MDVVGALIGVHRLEVMHVPHHVVLDRDAVAAVQVARDTRDVERLAAIVVLDDRDHLGRHLALVHQAADAQRGLQAERDIGFHVGELLLHELGGGKWPAELLAVKRILPGAVHAVFRGAITPQEMP